MSPSSVVVGRSSRQRRISRRNMIDSRFQYNVVIVTLWTGVPPSSSSTFSVV